MEPTHAPQKLDGYYPICQRLCDSLQTVVTQQCIVDTQAVLIMYTLPWVEYEAVG